MNQKAILLLVAYPIVLSFCLFYSLYGGDPSKNEPQKPVKLLSYYNNNHMILSEFLQEFKEELENSTPIRLEIINYEPDQSNNDNQLNKDQIKGIEPLKLLNNNDEGYKFLHGTSLFWLEKIPESVFFSAVPFGMDSQTLTNWMTAKNTKNYPGEGLDLLQQVFQKNGLGNIVPFLCGNTGPQWGGLSSVEISDENSFHGVHFRMAGLGGEILQKFKGEKMTYKDDFVTPDRIPDFAREKESKKFIEWVGPGEDEELIIKKWQFPDDTKDNKKILYYYTNGWQEPGTQWLMLVNKPYYEGLDEDVQQKLKFLLEKYNNKILSKYLEINELNFNKIIKNPKVGDVEIKFRQFNDQFKKAAYTELKEIMKINMGDKMYEKVHDSYYAYKSKEDQYHESDPTAVIRDEPYCCEKNLQKTRASLAIKH
jgi:TRAP-type mannitol/chloroaromatic compound transport system substrate-binding protein